MVLAVAARIFRPVAVDPVNEILLMPGWSIIACPASLPYPVTTLTTPGGMPASSASSAKRMALSDVNSDGLTTTVFPAASAGPTFHV